MRNEWKVAMRLGMLPRWRIKTYPELLAEKNGDVVRVLTGAGRTNLKLNAPALWAMIAGWFNTVVCRGYASR
jgi:hypothetical protein